MDNLLGVLLLAACLVLWFAYEVWRIWLNYRGRRDLLDLCRTFLTQGKEPPDELVEAVQSRTPSRGSMFFGQTGIWNRVVLFASLALGAVYEALFAQPDGRIDHDVLAVAFILGAMAVGTLLVAVLNRRTHDSS